MSWQYILPNLPTGPIPFWSLCVISVVSIVHLIAPRIAVLKFLLGISALISICLVLYVSISPSEFVNPDDLAGDYRVILGPQGGCNGGRPGTTPAHLARIQRTGSYLLAYNECDVPTPICFLPGRQMVFFNENASVLKKGDEITINAADGNSWSKVDLKK